MHTGQGELISCCLEMPACPAARAAISSWSLGACALEPEEERAGAVSCRGKITGCEEERRGSGDEGKAGDG